MTDERKDVLDKMLAISELIEDSKKGKEEKVGTINYYKEFVFQGSNLAETDIFIAKIENEKDNTITYEIYSGKTNSLIATVDEQGKLHFMPEYIERLKQIDAKLVEMINLEGLEFKLPQELAREDRILTKAERNHILSQQDKEIENSQEQDKKEEQQELDGRNQEPEKSEEEKQKEIARKKDIPVHDILMVKENSNLYKDHPNIEKNLFFYRTKSGAVVAEYIDKDGVAQPSKHFEQSTTSLKQETISLGADGNPITKEVPYQVMKTRGLSSADQDIRDVRININIDRYGYLEISEARQGKNGEWLSHNIEVKGREYNSHQINEITSIRTGNAEPDKQTETYVKAEKSGVDSEEIQYSKMYLIEHAEEFINSLIKEGYQRKEAIQIFDYMVGEEELTIGQAKERVNRQIGKEEQEQGDNANEKQSEESELTEEIEEEGRTPWGDAEAKRRHS